MTERACKKNSTDKKLYEIFDKFVDQSKLDSKDDKNIKLVTRIVRTELKSPSMLQNADLSLKTAKDLIAQGERKTFEELAY